MNGGDSSGRTMRRDALARRTALIEAARICFARSGYFVPLEEVADVAGVGRGTFYRNFKDRMALALAVFEREMDALGDLIDPTLPLDRALAHFAVRGAGTMHLFLRLAIDMPLDGENRVAFEALRHRLEQRLAPLVERGHRDGTLDPNRSAREVLLAMRMLATFVLPNMDEARARELVDEALAVVMAGLGPR